MQNTLNILDIESTIIIASTCSISVLCLNMSSKLGAIHSHTYINNAKIIPIKATQILNIYNLNVMKYLSWASS